MKCKILNIYQVRKLLNQYITNNKIELNNFYYVYCYDDKNAYLNLNNWELYNKKYIERIK